MDTQKARWRPAILRGVLIACMLMPWFDVSYYIGSMSVGLFNISDVLSQASTFGYQWLSLSGGGDASVPSGLAFVGMLAFLCGVVPIVRLAVEIYHCVVKHELPGVTGPLSVIIVALCGGALMVMINDGVGNMLSSTFGGSIGTDLLSLGLGWWAALIVAGVCFFLDRRDQKDEVIVLEVDSSGSGSDSGSGSSSEQSSTPAKKRDSQEGNGQEQQALRLIDQLEIQESKAYEALGRAVFPQLKDSEIAERFSDEFARVLSSLRAKEAAQSRLKRLHGKPVTPPSAALSCPSCGQPIAMGSKFCGYDGIRVTSLNLPDGWVACPQCGALAWKASGSCAACGHQLD